MVDTIGRIFTGEFDEILVRQKEGEEIEMGDLLTVDTEKGHSIFQVFDLKYGSQIPDGEKTLMAGMKLEGYGEDLEFTDPELSNFVVARLKGLVTVRDEEAFSPKKLPQFFSGIRRVEEEDLEFMGSPEDSLEIGNVRSGSKILDIDIDLPGEEVLRHHVLIPASTGKGKSNLVKVMAYRALPEEYCGILILDPHDEYYGRKGKGLSDHPESGEKLKFYSPDPPPGETTLTIHVEGLRPWHLGDVLGLNDTQQEALYAYYHENEEGWIENIVNGESLGGVDNSTLSVLQRKMSTYLNLRSENEELVCHGVFSDKSGETTLDDILEALEDGKTVVVDTSSLRDREELLIGAMVSQKIFSRYKDYKASAELEEKPVISVVIEEAPRVIGENSALASGNIFEQISREGRKFKIGLVAITQLPSVIPKEILANMNTKVILGMEINSERKPLIESAPQDLSKDDRNIASLDIGEAVVTSTFTKFAIPADIPLFKEIIEEGGTGGEVEEEFPGIEMED